MNVRPKRGGGWSDWVMQSSPYPHGSSYVRCKATQFPKHPEPVDGSHDNHRGQGVPTHLSLFSIASLKAPH